MSHHMILKTLLFMMVILCGALAYGEETVGPAQRTIPTTSAELLQLYKRAIEAKEKIQIPDDVLERARTDPALLQRLLPAPMASELSADPEQRHAQLLDLLNGLDGAAADALVRPEGP